MPKKYTNGKKPSGKEMKPADKSCSGECQYKIKEEVVDKKRVKESQVFDKKKKSSPRRKTKKY